MTVVASILVVKLIRKQKEQLIRDFVDIMTNAAKLLCELITRFCILRPNYRAKPGDFMSKLKPEERELIKDLKSKDVENIRMDFT